MQPQCLTKRCNRLFHRVDRHRDRLLSRNRRRGTPPPSGSAPPSGEEGESAAAKAMARAPGPENGPVLCLFNGSIFHLRQNRSTVNRALREYFLAIGRGGGRSRCQCAIVWEGLLPGAGEGRIRSIIFARTCSPATGPRPLRRRCPAPPRRSRNSGPLTPCRVSAILADRCGILTTKPK